METMDFADYVIKMMLGSPKLSIMVSMLSISMYMFNIMILRLRKHYLPMNQRLFTIMSLIPVLNYCSLFFNCVVLAFNVGGYTIRKKRMTKATYAHIQKQAKAKKQQAPLFGGKVS